MKALILAAGYAVRLGELTKDNPKPLLLVNGKTMIDRIIDKVIAVRGVDSVYIVINDKFYNKFDAWLTGKGHSGKISLINDGTRTNETRLGAIKDMELAIDEKWIEDDLLVVAGDNLFDFDLNGFIAFAQERQDGISLALYDIKDKKSAGNFGVIKIDDACRITDFEEKPQEPKSAFVSTGIYYFPKNKLSLIKKYVTIQDKKLDAPGYYIGWVSKNDVAYGYRFQGDWYDIGSVESYMKADADYKKKES